MDSNKIIQNEAKQIINEWDTIHIYGYGESQIIHKEKNGKVLNDLLFTLSDILSVIGNGTDFTIKDVHAINIFKGQFIDFLPSSKQYLHKRLYLKDIDNNIIQNLANEIVTKMTIAKNIDSSKLPNLNK